MFTAGWEFFLKGGPIMWPLLVCAVLSVAVMLERALYLRTLGKGGEQLVGPVLSALRGARFEEAVQLTSQFHGPLPTLLAEAINHRELPESILERRLSEMAMEQTPKLTGRIGMLNTIITVAPLLGLLGTVTGMIRAFHVVGDPSSLNGPSAITGGVAEALIATAAGLTIAIVTVVGYNALGERVKGAVAQLELGITQVLNVIAEMPSKQVAVSPSGRLEMQNENSSTRA